jgi:hypothetical protein
MACSRFIFIAAQSRGTFGFRIVGGTEEGSQVCVGYIVKDGPADRDPRIQTGDEIVNINGVNVVSNDYLLLFLILIIWCRLGMCIASSRGEVNERRGYSWTSQHAAAKEKTTKSEQLLPTTGFLREPSDSKHVRRHYQSTGA